MAHFAEIDENNIVLRVLVISNEDCNGGNFPESEQPGIEFIKSLGIEGRFLQTSYNNNFRKNFAGIGFSYNEVGDVFIRPPRYPSWALDENYDWVAPIPKPEEGLWYWNEEEQKWEELVFEDEEAVS